MAVAARPPAWINLEYLSAEPWVESAHTLPSPQPRLPLTRHFYFPGFTEATGVTRSGLVDLDQLRAMLESGPPALVSVMLANNETGAVQPIAEAAEIVHSAGGLLHVDAIQAFGKRSFDIKVMNADLVTLSAHKIGGPKGVGALALAEGLLGFEPLLRGGGQEKGRRAGTENVAGITGFGAAAKAAMGCTTSRNISSHSAIRAPASCS